MPVSMFAEIGTYMRKGILNGKIQYQRSVFTQK